MKLADCRFGEVVKMYDTPMDEARKNGAVGHIKQLKQGCLGESICVLVEWADGDITLESPGNLSLLGEL